MGRISDLPLCIIEIILCLLPYQDVVKTSILSKEWRYHWTKIPKIVLIVDTCQAPLLKRKGEQKQTIIKKSKLLSDIRQTLSMHEGPIHEFNFNLSLTYGWNNVNEVDCIISHLSSKNTVKKIILDFDSRWFMCLPLSLLSMSQLTYLYVNGWHLGFVLTSSCPKDGTSRLTYLYVHHSCFSAMNLLHLLSKCPLLKTLALTDALMIDVSERVATITNLLGCLPVIENLTLCSSFIESLALENLPKEVPIALVHLKHLCIENIYFGQYKALRVISLIIINSPNLEKLTIKIKDDERRGEMMTFSYTIEEYTDIWMERLSELEITYISGDRTEMDFVKLILMRSPVLKKLRIFISDNYKDEEMQISETLLSATRASPRVELIVEKEPF